MVHSVSDQLMTTFWDFFQCVASYLVSCILLSGNGFLTAERLDYTESLVRCGTFSIWSVDYKVLGLSSMYLASCILLSGKGGGVVTFDVMKLTPIPCPHI